MASIPTYLVDTCEAEEAWEAYKALQLAARDNPGLVQNKYFRALQDTAYARFLMNFEAA
jgi:hypothetical protein